MDGIDALRLQHFDEQNELDVLEKFTFFSIPIFELLRYFAYVRNSLISLLIGINRGLN